MDEPTFSPCCGAAPYGEHTIACDIVTGGGTIEQRMKQVKGAREGTKPRAPTPCWCGRRDGKRHSHGVQGHGA